MHHRSVALTAVWLAVGACGHKQADMPESAALVADREAHDFGEVPIDGGPVETVFRLVNGTADDVRLLAVSTSCGCTKATAEFADGTTVGSFDGSAGDTASEVGRRVSAGEEFRVRVEFDPAAHGPDGIGRILREIVLATPHGGQTRLEITANVVRG